MYYLTLTRSERAAIDWVGDRYSHGYELFRLLNDCEIDGEESEAGWDWYDEVTLKFAVPENVAWEISELIDQDGLACFSPTLQNKLYEFQGNIV